jgi:hypothetical protein
MNLKNNFQKKKNSQKKRIPKKKEFPKTQQRINEIYIKTICVFKSQRKVQYANKRQLS